MSNPKRDRGSLARAVGALPPPPRIAKPQMPSPAKPPVAKPLKPSVALPHRVSPIRPPRFAPVLPGRSAPNTGRAPSSIAARLGAILGRGKQPSRRA